MNCDDCKEQMVAYVKDGDAGFDNLREHLAGCPACRVEVDEMRRVLGVVDEALSNPIVSLVNKLLVAALYEGASEILIQAEARASTVRFRTAAGLAPKLQFEASAHEAVVSRIKMLAGIEVGQGRGPRSGRLAIDHGGERRPFMVATVGGCFGDTVAMRPLPRESSVPGLDELVVEGSARERIRDFLAEGCGLLALCGDGEGRSGAVCLALAGELNRPDKAVVTIERRIEAVIDGVTQMSLEPQGEAGLDCLVAGALTLAPDVLICVVEADEAVLKRLAGAAEKGWPQVICTLGAGQDLPETESLRWARLTMKSGATRFESNE